MRLWIRPPGGSWGSRTASGVTGQADHAAVTVSHTRYRCSLMLVCLPGFWHSFSVSLFRSVGQVTLRTGRSSSALSASTLLALWSVGFPGIGVNSHAFLRIPHADFFVAQMRSACRALSLHQLSIQKILGDPAIVHSEYMSEPAQMPLLQQCEHAEDFASQLVS